MRSHRAFCVHLFMKTIEQHLQTLPEPYRTLALKNADKEDLDKEYETLPEALKDAFHWNKAPEGGDFWSQVDNWAEWQEEMKEYQLPPIPAE